jgi:hypothetical protein
MEDVGTFMYGYFFYFSDILYFVIIWFISLLFWWISFSFVVLYQEKSGNPGANPTNFIYNASIVKICNATKSFARF